MSIRCCQGFSGLYIPFWLNLYGMIGYAADMLNTLYIPFWLNLYRIWTVKGKCFLILYIPFWLNLYERVEKIVDAVQAFTFHSG